MTLAGILTPRHGILYADGVVRLGKRRLSLFPAWTTGKLVRIQHGPATVIGDERRNKATVPAWGWEGCGQ